jgi:hypothetical protein
MVVGGAGRWGTAMEKQKPSLRRWEAVFGTESKKMGGCIWNSPLATSYLSMVSILD